VDARGNGGPLSPISMAAAGTVQARLGNRNVIMMRFCCKLSVFGIVLALLPGCPEKKEAGEAPIDLGTADGPLMPMAGAMLDPLLANGSADWVPFRELEDADAESGDEADKSANEVGGADTKEIEQEIRNLVKDYNDLVAERDIEEILVYHIDAQQDTVKSMYEAQFDLLDKLGEVEAALAEALPDQKERITNAFSPIRSASGGLTVTKLTVDSDSLVIGELKDSVTPICKFVLEDGDWFIDVPNLPTVFSQIKPGLDMVATMLGTVPQGLQSGQIQAETILAQLETQMKAMAGTAGSADEKEGDAEGAGADEETGDGGDSN